MDEIHDPEIPVLSLNDLGIVRAIEVKSPPTDAGIIEVTITATYSGCPAMDWIANTIKMELKAMGYQSITVNHSISPAWTTDWMSEQGKEKLKAYGIAPPEKRFAIPADGIPCPQCKSEHTRLLSEFGSTSCKALLQCQDCGEPFDYFKCH
ncbi:MAG: phenylacetate-CoA oxygenase subunit PaaJ [Bacteroidota bacterium]|jgi:ring-1,2-phenylacetyl-CoA epoxidase subunit PaaD